VTDRARRPARPKQFRAFTLIELLVVIAIIAVLIGILLPALGAARTSAWRLGSLTNMRSIAQATQMYVNEEDAYLPDPGYAFGFGTIRCWLFDNFSEEKEGGGYYTSLAEALDDPDWGRQTTGQLWPYLGEAENTGLADEIFRSPADHGPWNDDGNAPVEELSSYSGNGVLVAFASRPPARNLINRQWPGRFKLYQIELSTAITNWETAHPPRGNRRNTWFTPAMWGNEATTTWYGKWGSNVARIDGSGEWVGGRPKVLEDGQYIDDTGTGEWGDWDRDLQETWTLPEGEVVQNEIFFNPGLEIYKREGANNWTY
jgi:prepilin-type N-terminal cleavage/methylation domain-containing protein